MKTQLKHARSLQQKKFRDLHGAFLVQGRKVVGELLKCGWPTSFILATEQVAAELELHDAVIVPEHELARVGTLESGNEVIAVALKPADRPVGSSTPGELIMAFEGISDPGNLGTVLRLADWFGMQRVWCSAGSVDAFNPKCVQASMGAIFRVQVEQVDLPRQLEAEQSSGTKVFLASMEGGSVFEQELGGTSILVLGSESHGLSSEVRKVGGIPISVPGGGGAESLNVAMAATALCTEFVRQRGLR